MNRGFTICESVKMVFMRKHAELLQDPHAYIESIGKEDNGRNRLYNALENEGKDTVVRVCFSVPDRFPPVRALGYFAAATRVVEKYLPEAQLQFVATVHANERINNIPLRTGKAGARLLFEAAVATEEITPLNTTNVVYGFDAPELPEPPMHRIIPIMRHEPVSQQLARSAARRGAQFTDYLGAHLALHDAVDVVEPASGYSNNADPVTTAETLISIGAQSERAFYLARHLCRSALYFTFEGMVENTTQLFTRHAHPPYMYLRGSEEMFDPQLTSPASVRRLGELALDPLFRPTSIERDLAYLKMRIDGHTSA